MKRSFRIEQHGANLMEMQRKPAFSIGAGSTVPAVSAAALKDFAGSSVKKGG
jgi:hypothetical protein